jgi:hypothetical protein
MQAQQMMSDAINAHLGFRGYGLMMRLQKTANVRDLHDLLPDFAKALVKRLGIEPRGAHRLVDRATDHGDVTRGGMRPLAWHPRARTGCADRRPVLREDPGRIRRGRRQARAAEDRRSAAQVAPISSRNRRFGGTCSRGNKRSAAVDLRTPEGQRFARALATRADIVVENFRPGTLEGWNLSTSRWPRSIPASSWCASRATGRAGRTASGRASASSAKLSAACAT